MKDSKIILICTLISLSIFMLVALSVSVVGQDGFAFINYLDTTFVNLFINHRNELLNIIATDLTSLGSLTVTFIVLLLSTYFLFKINKNREGVYLITIWLGAASIPWMFKMLFKRPRPELETHLIIVHDLSFPSGHSFVATAFFVSVSFLYHRLNSGKKNSISRYVLIGFLLASLIGLSRIYLGVHYATDVIGGLALGMTWVLIITFIFNKFVYKNII